MNSIMFPEYCDTSASFMFTTTILCIFYSLRYVVLFFNVHCDLNVN